MKKLVISIGSLLIMAAIVVLFVNANDSKKETKKAKANVEAAAPCCSQPAAEKTSACDPATCTAHKEGEKCDPATCTSNKDGKCDPATCTAHAEAEKKEAEACKPSAGCAAKCPMTATK
jgi:hypothetical protein